VRPRLVSLWRQSRHSIASGFGTPVWDCGVGFVADPDLDTSMWWGDALHNSHTQEHGCSAGRRRIASFESK